MSQNIDTIARGCKLEKTLTQTQTNSGFRVTWDTSLIKCYLTQAELSDDLFLKNVVSSHILTGKLWPLVFDVAPTANMDTPAYFRSFVFFQKLIQDPSLLNTLNDTQMHEFMVGVRDAWLAKENRNLMNREERAIVEKMVSVVDDAAFTVLETRSVSLSLAPTRNRRVMRFVEQLEESGEGENELDCAARIEIQEREGIWFYIVWVDPRDLSYHNFECILPLDRILHRSGEEKQNEKLALKIEGFHKLKENMQVFVGKVTGSDVKLLQQLDALGLYQHPANAATRGGERFVFSSCILSNTLTSAINQLELYGMPESEDFVGVNTVFRCNRFSPGDDKFKEHMDTPYYDAARKHISRYTLIIYLSSGHAQPALRIGKGEEALEIEKIEEMQCVVFDQKYEHEGNAFLDSNKIFLRSELIFKAEELEHTREISSLFSSAVYYTLQSTIQPELADYAHTLYEKVNKAHWGVADKTTNTPQLLYKSWQDQVHFITNGYFYYFPFSATQAKNGSHINALKTFALIAVLDHFNCLVPDEEAKEQANTAHNPFRKACTSNILTPPDDCISVVDWAFEYLWDILEKDEAKNALPFAPISKNEKEAWFASRVDTKEAEKEAGGDQCCAPHYGPDFQPWLCYDTEDFFEDCVKYAREKLMRAPLIFLDNEVRIDYDCMVMEDDKIYINSVSPAQPINFASCWNSTESSRDYVAVQDKIPAPRLLLPPIPFFPVLPPEAKHDDHKGGFCLSLDFFHNDWALPKARIEREIPIPEYTTDEANLLTDFLQMKYLTVCSPDSESEEYT